MPQPHPFCCWLLDPYPLLQVALQNHTPNAGIGMPFGYLFYKPEEMPNSMLDSMWWERWPPVGFVGKGWAICWIQSRHACVHIGRALRDKYSCGPFAGIWLKMRSDYFGPSLGPTLPLCARAGVGGGRRCEYRNAMQQPINACSYPSRKLSFICLLKYLKVLPESQSPACPQNNKELGCRLSLTILCVLCHSWHAADMPQRLINHS
jgi:hypothetical protein